MTTTANDGVDLVDYVDDVVNALTAETIIVNYKRDNYYGDDVFKCCCCRGLQPCNNSCGGGGSQPCSCSLLPGPEHHLQEGTPPFFLIFLWPERKIFPQVSAHTIEKEELKKTTLTLPLS
jgi:hypothetical protein